MPNIRWLLSLITRIHRWIFLKSKGRIGGRAMGFRFLLLENIGRKSGRLYRTPLLYVEDEGQLVVVASNAGDRRDPAWLGNIDAQPEKTRVQVERESFPVRFRRSEGEERARLWEKLCESYPAYPRYERTAGRPIPVLVMERVPEGGEAQ